MKLTKKINIDVCRFIATLMVVAIHIYPLSSFSEDVDYIFTRVLFRIAVPLFLMITGYYILSKSLDEKNILKNYTFKIAKLYLICILIFLPINIYNGYFKSFSIIPIIKDIFLNGTFYHLWYFPSLLLGLWIVYFMLRKLNIKTTGIILILLYIVGMLGDNYFGLIKDIGIFNNIYKFVFYIFDYTRNGLFYTPIFIYIGYLISNKRYAISNKKSIVLIIINFSFLIIEGVLLYFNKTPRHSSMYISLIPLSFLMFNLIVNISYNSNKELRNISSWIYILHPLFIIIIHYISNKVHSNFLNNSLINYILTLILTLVFILIIKKVKEVIINGKGNVTG